MLGHDSPAIRFEGIDALRRTRVGRGRTVLCSGGQHLEDWMATNQPEIADTEASEMLDSKSYVYERHPSGPVEEMYLPSVVCFCDIPVGDLEIHMRKYNRFGLSFLKPFLIEKGANPVLYVANDSKSLPVSVPGTEEIVGRRDVFQANKIQYNQLMHALMFSDKSRLAQAAKVSGCPRGMSPDEWQWLRALWPKVSSFRNVLDLYVFSFVKYVDDSTSDEDPANVYMEREWRVWGEVNFELSDVYRVFLPEEFAERFRTDLPEYTGQLTFTGSA
jgi:hypothetical protein